jgi:hypothetical protein
LLESGPRTPFAIQFLKKFLPVKMSLPRAMPMEKRMNVAAKKIAALRQPRNFVDAKNPYFIDVFAISVKCVRCCVERASYAAQCWRCATLMARQRALHAANTQFVKRNTVFFILL